MYVKSSRYFSSTELFHIESMNLAYLLMQIDSHFMVKSYIDLHKHS